MRAVQYWLMSGVTVNGSARKEGTHGYALDYPRELTGLISESFANEIERGYEEFTGVESDGKLERVIAKAAKE